MNEVELVPMAEEHIEARVRILNLCWEEGTALLDRAVDPLGTAEWLRRVEDEDTRLDVAVLAEGRCIGVAGLVGTERTPLVRELYIFLAAEARGRGLGRRAVYALLELAFRTHELHRVYLWVTTANDAAVRLYERLGFTREGTLRSHLALQGGYVDRAVYGLLRDEWLEI